MSGTGKVRAAIAGGGADEAAVIRHVRAFLRDDDCLSLVLHKKGSEFRDDSGVLFVVDSGGNWYRPEEVPSHA